MYYQQFIKPYLISFIFLSSPLTVTAMEEQLEKRAIACFTCMTVRNLSPMPQAPNVAAYEQLVEQGNWRVGKWIYPPCEHCPQRLCRINTQEFAEKYFKDDLSPKPKAINKWPSSYKSLYKSLTVEILDAQNIHPDVLELYKYSNDLSEVDKEQFFLDYCTSPIGSVNGDMVKELNAGNYSTKVSGSMFVLIKSDDKPIAALLLDACDNWLGFKSFWYNDPNARQNKPVLVKMCWFKVFQLAQKMKYPHVQLSIFDPTNPRLTYKLNYSEMLEVNANNDGKWVPMGKLMEVIMDEQSNRTPKCLESYFRNIKHACKTQ